MDFYLASGNRHKLYEFQMLLPGFEIRIPSDDGIGFDPLENGKSFLENAMIKARALYHIVRKPVLADDSGLIVDALGDEPGIFSARYGDREAGRRLSTEERNIYLLDKLKNTKIRSARFICALVFLKSDEIFYIVQEISSGLISEKTSGGRGFGYDPLFYLPENKKTAAELSESEKNRISHRGKAARKLYTLLKSIKDKEQI